MMTEGAGGLGTANLAAVLDALDDDEPIGLWQFEEAARAELAALRAQAGRAPALAAALADCLPFLGNYQCDGMTEGDALSALEGRIAALLTDAERGGAGDVTEAEDEADH